MKISHLLLLPQVQMYEVSLSATFTVMNLISPSGIDVCVQSKTTRRWKPQKRVRNSHLEKANECCQEQELRVISSSPCAVFSSFGLQKRWEKFFFLFGEGLGISEELSDLWSVFSLSFVFLPFLFHLKQVVWPEPHMFYELAATEQIWQPSLSADICAVGLIVFTRHEFWNFLSYYKGLAVFNTFLSSTTFHPHS